MKYFLAIDIGASSGRHIIGWRVDEKIYTEEVYRFDNGVIKKDNHLIWDVKYLLDEVKKGIAIAKKSYDIASFSIDTWGVDYVLMKEDQEVFPVYAYRDNRTERVIDEVHTLIPFEKLYQNTGCQFQPFNSIYQLYDDKKQGRLQGVTDFLMIPEYLMYKLTGVKKKEFTNATTTGMINHENLKFDQEIIEKLNLPFHLFKELSQPKKVIGYYDGIKAVLCATHDTASAVDAIPIKGNQPYLSSGTWSLLGVKTDKPITNVESMQANFSNEGGVGYNRYQKNIMGLWIINQLHKELCPNENIEEIVQKASASSFEETIDANDSSLLAPKSMKKAFDILLKTKPENIYDYFKCGYKSLATAYKKAIEELEKNTGNTYTELYIVGGGAKNKFLNSLTEKETGKKVIALPIEATAIGNIKVQMM